ncbi:hypothetical protein EsH8_II_001561 [Colletotrichum jinshuiense]
MGPLRIAVAFLLALPAARAQTIKLNLVWFDDFKGLANTLPDQNNWIIDTGKGYPGGPANWGTWELQTYTNSPSNIRVNGAGNLQITAIKNATTGAWTSGRIETRKANFMALPKGIMRIQASLKIPNLGTGGVGYWPAFWTLGADYRGNYMNWPAVGEIDIMENVNNVDRIYGVLHCGTQPGGACNEPSGLGNSRACPGKSCIGNFHTYTVEVDRSNPIEAIRWYVDNVLYHQVLQTQMPAAIWKQTVQKPHFILLNLAIGGAFPDGAYGSKTPTSTTLSGGVFEAEIHLNGVALFHKDTITRAVANRASYRDPVIDINDTLGLRDKIVTAATLLAPRDIAGHAVAHDDIVHRVIGSQAIRRHHQTPSLFAAIERTAAAASLRAENSGSKKPRPAVPEYHSTPSVRGKDGGIVWPAPEDKMEAARSFIRECVSAGKRTLIVPDKDADGLASGVILERTLVLLGLDRSLITAYLPPKGQTIHDESVRAEMAALGPAYIFVLDHGSCPSPPLIDAPHRGIVIDHHHALENDHPRGALHVTACDSPPVATSSLLTYLICRDLHDGVERACNWLCVLGTIGDLGHTLKWEPPFPDMNATFETHPKLSLKAAVTLINAPRRTASYDVAMAWGALRAADSPRDLLTSGPLLAAKVEVNAEVDRCNDTAPQYSADGLVAVIRVDSPAQVHSIIATRWAGYLTSPRLEVILVANEGYLPGLVSFSCRVPCRARSRDPPVNIIAILQNLAASAKDPTLRRRLGDSFARGHKVATGGLVPKAEFEELVAVLEVGEKVQLGSPGRKQKAPQPDTLTKDFVESEMSPGGGEDKIWHDTRSTDGEKEIWRETRSVGRDAGREEKKVRRKTLSIDVGGGGQRTSRQTRRKAGKKKTWCETGSIGRDAGDADR